jgi:integrase
LRRADIEKAQADIRDGKTAKTEKTGKKRGLARVSGGAAIARGALVSLSSCYGWAVAQELVADNPVSRVKKLAAGKRERFLSEAEVATLLDTITKMETERRLSAEHADAIRLLILTGARRGEITVLAWSEVDLAHGVIKLPPARSKTGEKTIPVNASAAAILAARSARNDKLDKKDRSPFVFPAPTDHKMAATGLPKAWERVRTQAKLASLRIHDLRHSFASFAVAGGASLALIGKVLGHAQASTTERYAHFSEDPGKKLAEQVGRRIMNAGKAKKPGVVVNSEKKPARTKRDAG